MIFDALQGGLPKKTIALETKKGNSLLAEIGAPASDADKIKFGQMVSKYPSWEVRVGATGGYNCAGMVWATRRANLCQPNDWSTILEDDGYREVLESSARVGDIAVYFRKKDGEISHVGRICRIDYVKIVDSHPIPKVLSKMGPVLGECIHPLYDIVLDGGAEFDVKIYTDRPDEPDVKFFNLHF